MSGSIEGQGSFTTIAAHLNENLAAAALRLVDASQEFTSLIQSFVAAGEDLERSLSIHRELGSASQKALEESREAASASAAAAAEALASESETRSMLEKTTDQYGIVAGLVENLQQRIAALSVLAAPFPAVAPQAVEAKTSEPEHAAEYEGDDDNLTELRAAS